MVHLREQKGQSLVEFALIVPIFLLLILILINSSYYIFCRAVVNNACKNATRLCATGTDLNTVSTRIKDDMSSILLTDSYFITDGVDSKKNACTEISFTNKGIGTQVVTVTPKYLNTIGNGSTIRLEIRYNFSFPVSLASGLTKGMVVVDECYNRVECPPK